MYEIANADSYVLGGLFIIMAIACLLDELLYQLALRRGEIETVAKTPSKPKFGIYTPRNEFIRKLYFFGLYIILFWFFLRAFEVIVDPAGIVN